MTGADAFLETLAASGLPPLRGRRHGGDDFRAEVVTRRLGPLSLTELVTPEGECFRDARSARAADSEWWQIELVTRGWVRAEQGGSTAVLGPADLVLIDPVRPVRFASSATRHVTMLVPRQSLRLGPDDAARLAGVRIRGDRGPGALVSSLARDMARSLDGFRAEEADRSAAAVTELIAVALSAQLGDARPVADEAVRARVTGFIEARLSDRDLTPAKVAAAHHMSVRQLHKLFEDQPLTVAALIRRRRLERCRVDLTGTGRTVAAVAADWGFTDPAHFSRLFKTTYGYNAVTLTSNNRAQRVNASAARPTEDG
ncbi:helix-turn-helix domain-containing protein [Streptomyces tsukubensis]|uniref:AraC family transcriptional regulator n=1 Tax=Streptomyces tsukubensis TaxID=83656 RepID=A0A1V4AAF9_9ACTN|nr:helix-turn-helix domain-containing protein [Streptomyces tsukubensis]OON80152.1 AraC family transcriptional regulator [Streptomyces tsukubensis]QFR97382.1 helix-turn-helix domain-containing protein [Streptomyces tsukubensis]